MGLKFEGVDEVVGKFEQLVRDLGGAAFEQVIEEASGPILGDAQANAPRDEGNLVNSLLTEVSREGDVVEGVTGSKLFYAPFMEHGTGVFAGNRPHWPPGRALQGWAERHGFASGYQVARIIGMRGGLRPLKFLFRAAQSNVSRVVGLVQDGVRRIVQK